ncbi:putative L-asparaginase periplasmic [Clavelina lepadiformis]|uniref:putative L-asparaginase periplasmic n=1 Tax=Clavelina lepadiformis TaxID=159417 RepID=UPI004041E1D5
MDDENGFCVIQTGGTIDKAYPKRISGYAFEICGSAAKKILKRINPNFNCDFLTCCRVDSQDMTQEHREKLLSMCQSSPKKKILITHGTDTLIETAAYIQKSNLEKIVVLTGAIIPETFKDSDADFNVGFALGAISSIQSKGVFIAMDGKLLAAANVSRNSTTGCYETRQ